MDKRERLALLQGIYFAGTGLWPLFHIRSFEAITGPKRERWLVKTVGILVTAIGGSLVAAALRRQIAPELRGLALASAAGLAAVDIRYVARRRISPIYLGDAALEIALIAAWLAPSGRRSLDLRPGEA